MPGYITTRLHQTLSIGLPSFSSVGEFRNSVRKQMDGQVNRGVSECHYDSLKPVRDGLERVHMGNVR